MVQLPFGKLEIPLGKLKINFLDGAPSGIERQGIKQMSDSRSSGKLCSNFPIGKWSSGKLKPLEIRS
jgi:hypothetical protein